MSKLIKVGILISGKVGSSVKRATDAAVKDQGRVGSAIRKVNTQLGQAKEARKYARLLNDLKKKQRALGYSSERLDRGIEDVERRYNEARRAASRYGSEIGDVERQTRRLGDTQRRNGGASKGQIGTAIGAVGGAALTASVIGAGNREEAGFYLGTVINARDRDNDGDVDDDDRDAAVLHSRQAARAFGRRSLADEAEIIEIEYALNSAGLEEGVSRAGSRMVHKVAKITKGQHGQVGEIIATTFNNLGNQMVGTAEEKMERIGNILTKTQFQYQIRDFGQLGASMEYGLATAASYKIGLDQTAASIGFLNSAGFQGSRAGTTFAAMMRNMTKAGDELGFSMVRNANGSLDFMATMTELGATLEGLETDERADLIGKIFGDEGKGGVIAMLNDLDRLKEGYRGVAKAANGNLVNEKYNKALALSNSEWRMLRQNIGQTAVTIGSALLPVFNAVLKPVSAVMGWVAWGVENIPGVGLVIGVVATTVILLGTAMAAAATATWAWNAALAFSTGGAGLKVLGFVGMLTKGLWGLAVRAFPAVIIGTRALGLAIMTTPIGWIIGGIALVVGGLILLSRHFGGPSKAAKAAWSGIKTVFKWSPLGLLMRAIGAPLKWLMGIFGGPRKAAGAAWSGIKTIMSWSPLGLAKRAWDGLPSVYSGAMDLGRKVIAEGAKALTAPLMAPLKLVQSIWDKIRGVKKDAAMVKVGTAINDNFNPANDNDYAEPQVARQRVGAAYAELNGVGLDGIEKPRTPLQAPGSFVGAPSTTTHHREGDTNTYVFNGVLDGEEAVRKLEPHLKRREQENSEASLHD